MAEPRRYVGPHPTEYREGNWAGHRGRPISDSPFSAGDRSIEARTWRFGWFRGVRARRAMDAFRATRRAKRADRSGPSTTSGSSNDEHKE